MKLVKKFAAAVAAMALTVAMTTSCFAASWGSYFGQNEGWYEGAYGELKSSTDTSWTANMDAIGWGGCWGGQVVPLTPISIHPQPALPVPWVSCS